VGKGTYQENVGGFGQWVGPKPLNRWISLSTFLLQGMSGLETRNAQGYIVFK